MAKKNFVGPKGARLLRKVAKHILAEPKRFAMSWWYGEGTPGQPLTQGFFTERHISKLIVPECGTVACIAGWAVLLTDGNNGYQSGADIHRRAIELLGDAAEDALFGTLTWPTRFAERYHHAKTRRGKATAAVDRIEHFIKTGE